MRIQIVLIIMESRARRFGARGTLALWGGGGLNQGNAELFRLAELLHF